MKPNHLGLHETQGGSPAAKLAPALTALRVVSHRSAERGPREDDRMALEVAVLDETHLRA